MKSFFTKLAFVVIPSLLFVANISIAQTTGIQNPINVENIQTLIGHIVTIMIDIAVIVSVLFFIIAGLKMVMARGDPQGLQEAKGMIWYTAIGASVAIGAKSIQLVIENTVNQLQQ